MKGVVGCVAIGLMMWTVVIEGARPFATDDAGTVEIGGYELEIGNDEGALGIGFKHGLTNRMDVGVGFGYAYIPMSFN